MSSDVSPPLDAAAAAPGMQARLMAAILAKPPLTPATMELFKFENATDLDEVDRQFGFHPHGFRDHLRAHGIAGSSRRHGYPSKVALSAGPPTSYVTE